MFKGREWVTVHLPRRVADEVGTTSRAAGVTKYQAIAAALWVFSQLTLEDRARVIAEYLQRGLAETIRGP